MSDIDIREKYILEKFPGVLEILISDHSSKKTLVWGTNNYSNYGFGYQENDYMSIQTIVGYTKDIIKPRIKKSIREQKNRSKTMAEIFTPAWICNKQNNLIDDEWFGYKGAFNIEKDNSWLTTNKVEFKNKSWKEYINEERMEITCGEAPYLTSRYDVVNGYYINPLDRIGLLDRKLRVISENVDDINEWQLNAELAFKRTYGYDFQGDNVLIARENLLFTYLDFFENKFKKIPNIEAIIKVAKIISWNIWQMDGLKYVIPYSCKRERLVQLSLFYEYPDKELGCACVGCKNGNNLLHNGIYCSIKDWRANKIIRFIDLIK